MVALGSNYEPPLCSAQPQIFSTLHECHAAVFEVPVKLTHVWRCLVSQDQTKFG